MNIRSRTHRFPLGLRCVFVFGLLFFTTGGFATASTKEERKAAWGIFQAAKDNIVAKCIYRPKPEDVVWGALAGLARELGPDKAKYFPEKMAGPIDEAMETYVGVMRTLEDNLHIPLKTLVARSIRAYCRNLDRYSDYDDFETWARSNEAGKFDYVGTGMALFERPGQGFLLDPFPDSPAERAGIVSGDYLLEVNGISVKGMSKAEVFAACLGKEGTKVAIKVQHADQTVGTINVVREKMTTSPLRVEHTASGIQVACPGEITNQAVEDFRTLLRSERPGENLTIDFRGCPGGTVDAGVALASLFLPTDAIIGKLETVNGQEKLISTNKTPYHPSKLIILQDRFTASAAELIIAALVSNRGLSVETQGERTYGKGVTQRQVEIFADDNGTAAGILLITDTRVYGPNNEVWDGEGLPPTAEAK
jgi:carboxyl-terminal processing protease